MMESIKETGTSLSTQLHLPVAICIQLTLDAQQNRARWEASPALEGQMTAGRKWTLSVLGNLVQDKTELNVKSLEQIDHVLLLDYFQYTEKQLEEVRGSNWASCTKQAMSPSQMSGMQWCKG
jgi:hypothetical protein